LFKQTAELYDLIYSWKDYPREAARLRELVGHEGGALLDVACGTGKHLEELAQHYRCEGLDLDPAMVEIARERGLTVHIGDLTTFDLGRRFDVVTCLFSSIGYAPDLEAAVANLRRHVATGGVLVVEPWLSPEMIIPGLVSLRTAETDTLKVARMDSIDVAGRLSALNLHYLVGRGGAVEHLTERHEAWLWTREEYAGAFAAAGLEATYDEEGLMGRGLWLGVSR
jgi:SAM-dependent methyltransferase